MISIVIPTLNAAATLPATITALQAGRDSGRVGEILVIDGGSTDRTMAVAEAVGAKVLHSAPGRGGQLQRGAVAAKGEWFLFLHGDTILAKDWLFAVENFISDEGNRNRAAAFRFALDDPDPKARRLEKIVAWRCTTFGLPYGDQGLLISRPFYGRVGGYRDLPLMEDVDLVRRIGRRRLAILAVAATTSAKRYRQGGYGLRPARNLLCLSLYFLRVPPKYLVKLYK